MSVPIGLIRPLYFLFPQSEHQRGVVADPSYLDVITITQESIRRFYRFFE
jgi:hypothetical protein